jgi:hypothetical protein
MRLAHLKRLMRIPYFDQIILFLKAWQKLFKPQDHISLIILKENYDHHKNQLYPEKLITGEDLIGLGLKPSSKFRLLLDEIENLQLEGLLLTKLQAMEWIKRSINEL